MTSPTLSHGISFGPPVALAGAEEYLTPILFSLHGVYLGAGM